jgi:DNA repair exonuclease SbcCD nuclease subunit
MSSPAFRFVHASDFHLETPPCGVAEVPDHLRELFLEAPYWAAERVFETVLGEEAEFLVLSGDLLHPRRTGPRGPLFLAEQFERLAQREIPVYWVGGRVDPPEAWPRGIQRPENVHVFPQGQIEDVLHQHHSVPLVRLAGTAHHRRQKPRVSDFHSDPVGLFSMALVYGTADSTALQSRGIHYWALGGRHNRSTLFSSTQVAHYPGSPQGRRPEEAGVHGCTVVEVDEERRARLSLSPTDVMRWLNERVEVDATTSRVDLESLLRERMLGLIESNPNLDLLVSWTIVGSGPLLAQLRRGALAAELLGWLRSEYGFGPPAAWSLSLQTECSFDLPPQQYEEETIRGDFLRAIRQLQINPSEPLDLQSYLTDEQLAEEVRSSVIVAERSRRERVLREAALLGVDLLSGEDPQS